MKSKHGPWHVPTLNILRQLQTTDRELQASCSELAEPSEYVSLLCCSCCLLCSCACCRLLPLFQEAVIRGALQPVLLVLCAHHWGAFCWALASTRALFLALEPAQAHNVVVKEVTSNSEYCQEEANERQQLPVDHLGNVDDSDGLVEECGAVVLALGVQVESCERHEEFPRRRQAWIWVELVLQRQLLSWANSLEVAHFREVLYMRVKVRRRVQRASNHGEVISLASIVVNAQHNVNHTPSRKALSRVAGQDEACADLASGWHWHCQVVVASLFLGS
mmetsp:Transcript_17513/g.30053  ORF Transcript_17513/g.30053 Transcript_17513/m.30053 type:complete len:277 (+) Transcript_17513:498-1328(+)